MSCVKPKRYHCKVAKPGWPYCLEYHIEHVDDFLKVPKDRLADCLAEFKDFLDTADAVLQGLRLADDIVGTKTKTKIDAFVWVDDGKSERSVRIETLVKPTLKESGEI